MPFGANPPAIGIQRLRRSLMKNLVQKTLALAAVALFGPPQSSFAFAGPADLENRHERTGAREFIDGTARRFKDIGTAFFGVNKQVRQDDGRTGSHVARQSRHEHQTATARNGQMFHRQAEVSTPRGSRHFRS